MHAQGRRFRSGDAWLLVGVCVLSLVYLSAGITRRLNIYDEGLIVYGAERVLRGDIPYRDFWTVYSPGQFYTLAAIFKLVGPSILAARVWDTLVRALLAVSGFLLARRWMSRGLALFVWGLVLLWVGYYEFYGYPTFVALFLTLVCLLALTQACEATTPARRNGWLLATGLGIGLATLYRHDFGLYVLVATLLSLLPLAWEGYKPRQKDSEPHPLVGRLLRLLVPPLAGMALLVVPVVIWLLATVPLEDLGYQLVVFPVSVFPKVRALPYPAAEPGLLALLGGHVRFSDFLASASQWLPFYFPLAVYSLAAVVILWRLLSKGAQGLGSAWRGAGFLVLFALASFNQARVRADLVHLVQLLVPAWLVLGILVAAAGRWRKALGWAALVVSFPLVLLLLKTPVDERITLFQNGGPLALARSSSANLERTHYMPVDSYQAQAIAYVQGVVPEDQRILVGVGHHDRIFVNDVLFYFLAARECATSYHELHPGVATSQIVQMEIVYDLKRYDVQYIVRYTAYDDVREPNGSGISSQVTVLDDFIRQEYQPVAQFGPIYTVLKRR